MSYIVMKQKILFIMHMPPPVHGAAMVGQYIHDSKLINDKFDSHYINLTTAKNLQDIGKVGIRKLVDFIMLLRRIRKSLKEIRPDLVYVTPNACGGAFYKDYIVKGIKVILLSECLYSDVMKYVKREDVFVSQPSITMSVFLWYYWRLCSIICLVFLQQRVVFLVS